MKKIISLLLAVLLLATAAVPALAESEAMSISETLSADSSYNWAQLSEEGITLNVYNWGLYISDGSDGTIDVIDEFETLTGIDVNYTTFASNEEMYTKVSGGGASYDVIIPSDYMIARMAEEGMLAEIDKANIPNIEDIDPTALGLAFDPENTYSVPYTMGAVGMIYNTTIVEGTPDSWALMWDEKYSGDILQFNNSRDAFAIAQKLIGNTMNPQSPDALEAAADKLKEQKPLVQQYVMDEVFDKMEGGSAAVAAYYAGDAVNMLESNPDLAFVYPKEGVNIFVDSMVIPVDSPNKHAAEIFINFMCEGMTSAANSEYNYYGTPVLTARELLPEEMINDPMVFIPSDVIANGESFSHLPEEVNEAMDALWVEIRSEEADANFWIMPLFIVVLVLAIGFVIFRRLRKKKKDY